MTTGNEVETFLRSYPEEVCDLALELRVMIHSTLPDVQETLDRPARIVSFGYGPGYKDMICTIIPSKGGVKLGIVRGAELDDPHELLTGSGKVHRHVPFASLADLKQPGITPLVKSALAAWKTRRDAKD